MNIEIGKYYRTKSGRKVRIYALDGHCRHPIHGAIYISGEWIAKCWTKDGAKSTVSIGLDEDLIAPWIDKPEFDRTLLPAWCNKAIAMNASGFWFCYDSIPVKYGMAWIVSRTISIGVYFPIPTSHAPKWSGDWEQSLLVFEDEKQNQKGEG